MRFIVDLYKYLIYLGLAALIIGMVLAIAEMMRLGATNPLFVGLYLYAAIAMFIAVVMTLGILATFISIHDRHAEIADELRELRNDLRAKGGQ